MSRLPPFIALRALEAAARHRSYSRAADELAVTHGAVSQQIRRLEEDFGARLFIRRGNLMEPTPAATALAARVAEAIAILHDGVTTLTSDACCGPLVLSTVPAFAARWLAPRLGRLPASVGDLQLRVEERMADLTTDGVDIGLRHGVGPWPGLCSAPLFPETLFPVCSPAFLERHPIREPANLRHVPLLRHTVWRWSLWFSVQGIEAPGEAGGLVFDDSAMLVEAAIQGLGVALARNGLVEQDLLSGRLVRPVSGEVGAEVGYHVVWRDEGSKLARVLALRDWLLAEAAALKLPG